MHCSVPVSGRWVGHWTAVFLYMQLTMRCVGRLPCAGDRLIEHLKRWLEPEKLMAGPRSWELGEEPAIAALILELFHLLPAQAVKFLETHREF